VVDVQIVAFPQLGLANNPAAVDLMYQAMELGANVVGGMPHGERDMDAAARHIEIAFEIAKAYDADIDMHTDETDDPYWRTLEILAEKTLAEGYAGRVVASHCCALGSWDDATAARVIAKVAQAGVNVTTNVPVNLLLQGRGDSHPFRRGIPRVKELLAAGVNVATGQDDLLNMFYPFGKMDPLEVANFAAHSAHLSSVDLIQTAFDMPRYNAARNLRLAGYGLREGGPADLMLLPADSAIDALRRQPERTLVMRAGQVLAESQRHLTYAPGVPQ
jgi:cytosine deaminase